MIAVSAAADLMLRAFPSSASSRVCLPALPQPQPLGLFCLPVMLLSSVLRGLFFWDALASSWRTLLTGEGMRNEKERRREGFLFFPIFLNRFSTPTPQQELANCGKKSVFCYCSRRRHILYFKLQVQKRAHYIDNVMSEDASCDESDSVGEKSH